MLMLNCFSSACIVKVGHASSLYVNTTASMKRSYQGSALAVLALPFKASFPGSVSSIRIGRLYRQQQPHSTLFCISTQRPYLEPKLPPVFFFFGASSLEIRRNQNLEMVIFKNGWFRSEIQIRA